MKKLLATTLAMAALAVTPIFAAATPTLRGTIPFDFVVAGKTLPAGDYEIADSYTDHSLLVRSLSGKRQAAIALAGASQPSQDLEGATLTFASIDGKHYLVRTSRPGSTRELGPRHTRGGSVLAYVKAALR